MRPRRGDAPPEAELLRRRVRSGEAAYDECEQSPDPDGVREEMVGSEDDASLRPLAQALLALAEQLRREEGS